MRTCSIVSVLSAVACSISSVHATSSSAQVGVDSRSLDEIYAAARQESGALQVFWGGDGKYVHA